MAQKDTNEAIQGLRAIAALLVVVSHSILTMRDKAGASIDAQATYALGELGVRVFFLISGFIMTATMMSSFGKPGAPADFLRRRLIRIVPLYWLATLLYAARLWFGGSPLLNAEGLLKSFVFIPYENEAGLLRPVYGLGWTLNYEMFFYALFAGALFLPKFRGLLALFVVLVAFGAIGDPLTCSGTACDMFAYYTRPIILYFAAGMGLSLLRAHADNKGWRLPIGSQRVITFSLLACAGYGAIAFLHQPGEWLMDALTVVTSFLVCTLCVTAPSDLRPTFLRTSMLRVGDASYSIYLTHSFLLGPAGAIWGKLFGGKGVAGFVGLAFLGAILVGLLCYRYVEKPIIKWLLRQSVTSSSRSITTAAN